MAIIAKNTPTKVLELYFSPRKYPKKIVRSKTPMLFKVKKTPVLPWYASMAAYIATMEK
jgi:hypothetical protein